MHMITWVSGFSALTRDITCWIYLVQGGSLFCSIEKKSLELLYTAIENVFVTSDHTYTYSIRIHHIENNFDQNMYIDE